MKPVNLGNNRIALVIPLSLKKKLYEESRREGMNLSSYVIQILWEWVRNNDKRMHPEVGE